MALTLKKGNSGYPWNHQKLPSEVRLERLSPEFPEYLRVLLVAHVGPALDAWQRIQQYVDNVLVALGNQVELIVTIAKSSESEAQQQQLEKRFADRPQTRIVILENRGMDVGPFLWCLNLIRQKPIGQQPHILIKIHTKTHDQWRRDLCDPLFGSPMTVAKLINYLAIEQGIGMLGSAHNIYNTKKYSGLNKPLIEQYLRALRLPSLDKIPAHGVGQLRFVGGTIFYARTEALESLTNGSDLFSWQEELATARQTDAKEGQKTHALERLFGVLVQIKGLKLVAV